MQRCLMREPTTATGALSMKIDILYDFPQVFSDADYEGIGVGGTECYIILTSRLYAKMGHDVTVFNSTPYSITTLEGVEWKPIKEFEPRNKCDMLFVMRTMSNLVVNSNANKKIIVTLCRKNEGLKQWCMDNGIDLIVSVSNYQADLLIQHEAIDPIKLHISSSGVDFNAYTKTIKKIPGKCIYCSVPYRGLEHLLDIWPKIKQRVPWASLYITSSYLLWGVDEDENSRRCEQVYNRMMKMKTLDVFNLIRLPKHELIKHQLESELMLYPSNYDEMCCIAALECAAAGCAIVTSGRAALSERVDSGKSGYLISGEPSSFAYQYNFVEAAAKLLLDSKLQSSFGMLGKQIAEFHSYENLTSKLLKAVMEI